MHDLHRPANASNRGVRGRRSAIFRQNAVTCGFATVLCLSALLPPLPSVAQEPQPPGPPVSAPAPAESSTAPKESAPAPADAVTPAPPDTPDAKTLLRQSRERVRSFRTLRASISETAAFGPRRFEASGTYLQGEGRKLRLELDVTIAGATGHLLQVCDGDVLYTLYDTGGTAPAEPAAGTRGKTAGPVRVTRRDVNQIFAAIAKRGSEAQTRLVGELGLGGVSALLAAVERSMTFEPPQMTTLGGRTFYVLDGVWNADIREGMAAQLGGADRPLPAHIPDAVRVYLDTDQLFPHRLRYLKTTAPGEPPQPLLTMDFRDVVANAAVEPREFTLTIPPDAVLEDVTNKYVQMLQQRDAETEPGE